MTYSTSSDSRSASAATEVTRRAASMFALLERQHKLHDGLAELAGRQQKSVTLDDTRPLLEILAKRERVTNELLGVAGELKPLLAEFDTLGAALAPEKRDAARTMIASARRRLSELIASDSADAQKLQIRKQRTGEKLCSTHTNRQAVAAYGESGSTGANPVRMQEQA